MTKWLQLWSDSMCNAWAPCAARLEEAHWPTFLAPHSDPGTCQKAMHACNVKCVKIVSRDWRRSVSAGGPLRGMAGRPDGLRPPRLAWFHPEKTGTSFGTTLVHYANSSLPPHVAMPSCDMQAWHAQSHLYISMCPDRP